MTLGPNQTELTDPKKMEDLLTLPTESVGWIADTGLFIACGRQQNNKYTALERFVKQHEITFVIPRRVYKELGGAPDRSTPGQTPINSAIDSGWVEVAPELDYTNSAVSKVMDDIRTYIANSSNRNENEIEKADTALGAVAIELFQRDEINHVCIVTTDIDAGEGSVNAVAAQGYQDRIYFENGFDFITRIT